MVDPGYLRWGCQPWVWAKSDYLARILPQNCMKMKTSLLFLISASVNPKLSSENHFEFFTIKMWQILPWFSWEGEPTPKVGVLTYYFCNFFDENCMKMKEFGPKGGAHFPGSANVYLLYLQKSQKKLQLISARSGRICQISYHEKLE